MNSLATYSSSWLRIKFDHDEIKTDDPFQGKAECLILTTSSNNKLFEETIIFEDWIHQPFSIANQKSESAVNLAQLYWQGLDPKLNQNIPNKA